MEQSWLETDHLILRPIARQDAADLFEYASDSRVTDWTRFPTHQTLEDSIHALEHVFLNRPQKGWPEAFALVLKANNKMIGTCDFWPVSSPDEGVFEMGYALNPAYWGNGYMTEAAQSVLRFAFEVYGVRRMRLSHLIDNIGSQTVANRCGFIKEGVLRKAVRWPYGYADVVIYGLLKEDYDDRKISKKI